MRLPNICKPIGPLHTTCFITSVPWIGSFCYVVNSWMPSMNCARRSVRSYVVALLPRLSIPARKPHWTQAGFTWRCVHVSLPGCLFAFILKLCRRRRSRLRIFSASRNDSRQAPVKMIGYWNLILNLFHVNSTSCAKPTRLDVA